MKILFLTRKYPPSIGGMQAFSYNLVINFQKINQNTCLIANQKGERNLPFFFPYSLIKAWYLIKKNKLEILHLGDGLMAPLGYFLKKLTGVKTAITVHGLDIIYPNRLYQKIIPFFLNKIDLVICNSRATKKECLKRGILSKKCVVVSIGVNSNEFVLKIPKKQLRLRVFNKFKITEQNQKILLSVGRLVKRKGIVWFLNQVLPKLNSRYLYFISGDGPEKNNIQKIITQKKLQKRVFLLGKTDSETLKLLYNSADIFVMPNIKVKGDIEGFGIVALEAASCGLPVIASNIEGIKDAVLEGKTGFLIEEKNSFKFIEAIKKINLNQAKIIKAVQNKFSWTIIVKQYHKILS